MKNIQPIVRISFSLHIAFRAYITTISGSWLNFHIGATGWDNSGGGAASGWNDSVVETATDDNNFGEAGGDNYNGGSGNNAGGEGGAGDSTCRRCGQGESSLELPQLLHLADLSPEGHLAKDCDQVRLKFTQISPQDAESRSHIRWERASTV